VRAFALLVALVCSTAHAENKQLAKAESLVNELRFADAAKALEAAWKTPDNDHATVLRILELNAVTQATLQRAQKAEDAFRLLFALNPDFKLQRELGPRVMTPYYQAKSWVTEHGGVSLSSRDPTLDGDQVTAVGVQLTDGLKVVQSVKLHVRDGESWRVEKAAASGGKASVTAKVHGAAVQYWAEALGDRNTQLQVLGSAAEPLIAAPPPPPQAQQDKPVRDVAPADAPPTPPLVTSDVEARPVRSSPLRPVAYVMGGVAVAAGIVGAIFAVQAGSARSQLANATYDMAGHVLTPTQAEAAHLESQLSVSAIGADVLFAAAGALAVTAVLLWFLGAP
jgi:hypothetical protein